MRPNLLRPLGAGDLIDEAVWLYRKNFLRFLILIAVLRVPFSLLVGAFSSPRDETPMAFTLLNWVSMLINNVLINSLLATVVAYTIADSQAGKSLSVRRTYRRVLAKLIPLLINYALAGFVYGLSFGLGLLCAWVVNTFLLVPIRDPYSYPTELLITLATVVIDSLIIGIPFLYLVARWSVTQQVIVLESRGPREAFARSVALMQGQHRRVMIFLAGLFFLGIMLSTAPSFASQAIGEIVSPTYQRASATGVLYLLFGFAIPTAIDLLFLPITFIARTLLYYDLRVRAEGYDLAVRVSHWAEQAT